MKMGGQRPQAGFTIVEVMIVMAVTGILFVSVALLISGKQASAEFGQAIHDIESQMQQTINEVASGYYPNSSNFQCLNAGSSISISSGTNQAGTNQGCIFLGKVVHFYSAAGSNDHDTVYSLAGINDVYDSLANAKPAVITNTGSPAPVQSGIDNSVDNPLGYGLSIVSMSYNNGAGDIPIGSVGFTQSLGVSGGPSGLVSGSLRVDLVAIGGTSPANNKQAEAAAIDSSFSNANFVLNPTAGIKICFASGTTNQSGLISIGNNGHELAVTLNIFHGKLCS